MKPLFLCCNVVLSAAVLFSGIGCRKPIPEGNPDLIGYWVNTASCQDQLTFSADGTGNYRVRGAAIECKSGDRTEGDALLIRNKKIKIGHTRFEIISGPVRMDTVRLTVDDVQSYTGKSVMSMVLKKSVFNTGETYTFCKIIGR